MRLFPLFFVALACAPTATRTKAPTPEETDLETAFCNLLQDGPEVEAIAGNGQYGGPELFVPDTVVELDRAESSGGWGWAWFTPDEAGTFVIGLSEDMTFMFLDEENYPVWAETEVVGSDKCAELAVRYTLTLENKPYTVHFDASELPEVDVVAEESDDDL